ncbi:hypothetical protein NPIL_371911, partial [Nephila pilipes]
IENRCVKRGETHLYATEDRHNSRNPGSYRGPLDKKSNVIPTDHTAQKQQ